jgi:thymidylate kinase
MKIVACIEGADGSGKSTLTRELVRLCESKGISTHVIGRKADDSTPTIGAITGLSQRLQQDDASYPVETDIHLRLAREYLRAEQCMRSTSQLVILDRFVLSVLSRVRAAGLNDDLYIAQLQEIAKTAGLNATIYCDCPFEVAWARVNASVASGDRSSLSPKEQRGSAYLRDLDEWMRRDFRRLEWLGNTYSVMTAKGSELMRTQCAEILERWFP